MNNDRRTAQDLFRFVRHWCLVAVASGPAIFSGCGTSQKGPPLVPAEGIVTLDGKPLSGATVMLVPRGETRGATALYGKTDSAGKFGVTSPDGKHKGASVGNYQVVINKLVKPDGSDFVPDPKSGPEDTGGFREVLPTAYSDPARSALTADVPDGGTKSLEFKLNSKQK
jgi:hypothetical protein